MNLEMTGVEDLKTENAVEVVGGDDSWAVGLALAVAAGMTGGSALLVVAAAAMWF